MELFNYYISDILPSADSPIDRVKENIKVNAVGRGRKAKMSELGITTTELTQVDYVALYSDSGKDTTKCAFSSFTTNKRT